MNKEAFVSIPDFGKRHFYQTVCSAAICACKMRVALSFGAIMGQFEMSCSIFDEGFVYDACLGEGFECSVDCYFIELIFAEPFGDLVVSQGVFGLEQHFDHGESACGAVELCGFQYPPGLCIRISFHWSPFLSRSW